MGRSVATVKRWEKKGWLTFTLGRVREADLLEAEKKARSNHGGARVKGAHVDQVETDQAKWPDGAEPDGRLYSLEVLRCMEIAPYVEADGAIVWVPSEPGIIEPPGFERRTGTYAEISKWAVHYNALQQRSGFTAFVFYPSPIEPQGAR